MLQVSTARRTTATGSLTPLGRESLTQRHGKTDFARSMSNASAHAIKLRRQARIVGKRNRYLEGQMAAFSAGRLSVGGR
jgi:hypothetical protein